MVLLCCGIALCHSWQASVVSSSWSPWLSFLPQLSSSNSRSHPLRLGRAVYLAQCGSPCFPSALHMDKAVHYDCRVVYAVRPPSGALQTYVLGSTHGGLWPSGEGSPVESAGPILDPCCPFVRNTPSTLRLRVHIPGLVGGFDGAVELDFLATVAFSLEHVQGSPRVESGGWLHKDRHLVTFNCTSTFDGTCRNRWKTYVSSTTSCTGSAGWISGRGTLNNSKKAPRPHPYRVDKRSQQRHLISTFTTRQRKRHRHRQR